MGLRTVGPMRESQQSTAISRQGPDCCADLGELSRWVWRGGGTACHYRCNYSATVRGQDVNEAKRDLRVGGTRNKRASLPSAVT